MSFEAYRVVSPVRVTGGSHRPRSLATLGPLHGEAPSIVMVLLDTSRLATDLTFTMELHGVKYRFELLDSLSGRQRFQRGSTTRQF